MKPMTSAMLPYGQSHIHYLHAGKGNQWIVALHGYGESAASFRFLEKHLGNTYRMLAIDLPFHGHTFWKEDHLFTSEDLAVIINNVLNTLGAAVNDFILMGYSMGGKLALSLTQYDARKISKLVLIAPEGIKTNVWQWLSTQTRAGNRLFKFTMKHPGWFHLLLRAASRFKLAHSTMISFAWHAMRNGKARENLFNRWTCLRKCTPHAMKITTIIRQRKLPVRILQGQHDPIMQPTASLDFTRNAGRHCRLFLTDAGHRLLTEKHAGIITRLLET